jgi:hypothetical protein
MSKFACRIQERRRNFGFAQNKQKLQRDSRAKIDFGLRSTCKVNKIQYKNSQVEGCKDILDESNFED